MENVQKQIEDSALTYGTFVMCEAAEILLRLIIGKGGDPKDGLKQEAKMYYTQLHDGLQKAYRGAQGLNNKIQSLYSELGASVEQMDKIRTDANHMVRMFCHSRNLVDDKSKSLNADEILKDAYNPESSVISQETIEKFTLR